MRLRVFWLAILVVFSVSFVIFEFAPNASAATITVDDDGPADYNTIQAAINAAIAGDLVYVYSGTYNENVDIDKTITLEGEERDLTIINGGGGDVVSVSAAWVNITGFTVTGGGGMQNHGGIELSGVHNCSVMNNYITGNGRDGIRVLNTVDSTVEDNLIENNGDEGIHMEGSFRNDILNNTVFNHHSGGFTGGSDGVLVLQSSDNTVDGNTLYDNDNGVQINDGANRNTIANNNISINSQNGIYIEASDENYLINNVISDHTYGVYISNSNQVNMTQNSMTNNGIFIFGGEYSHWDSHEIDTTNTANGKEVYYWKFQSGATIPAGAGQVLLINCTDIIIDSQDLSNATVGVETAFSVNTMISGVNASNGVYGFYIYISDGTNITGCDAHQNNIRGIYLGFSTANNITNSNAMENGNGIVLRETTFSNINGNSVSSSSGFGFNIGYGIVLESSSHDNMVSNNMVNFNSNNGIYLLDSHRNGVSGNTILYNSGNGLYIRDCNDVDVHGNNVSLNNNGIYIRGVDSSEFTDNRLYMNQVDGFYVRSSLNNNITENDVSYNNDDGFYIRQSSGNNFTGNDANWNNDIGIYVFQSNWNDFYGNNASNNQYGVSFDSCGINYFIANNASYNDCGIYLTYSTDITLIGNEMVRDGIFIDQGDLQHWNTHTIDTANTVNGKPVYYWKDQNSGSVPSDGGEVILANCTNIDVSNGELTLGTVGIEMGFSSGNNLIVNNASSNNWYGIYLYYSDGNTLWFNTASYNTESGIHIGYSSTNTLTSNMMERDGVWIEGDQLEHWNTHNIDITNTVNADPVFYWKDQSAGSVPTNAGEIILANCTNVLVENTNPDWGTVGILIGFSNDNTFDANNLSNNLYGLYLYDSDGNTVLNNTVSYNTRYGIALASSSSNLIYHNNIIENTNQAFDDRFNNMWNEAYPVSGNYWSDYSGPDIFNGPFQDIPGADGVGDIQNPIDMDSIDYYPLINPWDLASLPPTEPLSLVVVAGKIFVNLTWAPPLDDGGYPIVGYRIYRGNASDGETFYIDVPNILTFNDTSVTPGETYYYKVTALTIVGESPQSNEDFGMPFSEPSEPQNLIASSGDSYVNLTWDPPAMDGGYPVTNYVIYRGTSQGTATFLIEIGDFTFYNDTTAVNGITYYYNISAKNSVGEGPLTNEVSATPVTLPGAPENANAQEGDMFVNLTWDVPSDNGGSSITGYNIYRDDTPGVYWSIPAGQLWFNDTSLTNGVTYSYIITAINGVGEGPGSLEISATPKRPPYGVSNLQANEGDSFINLTWLVPLNDGGSPVTGYRVYKGTEPGNLTLLADLGPILYYVDTNVTNGNTYYYTVSALNIMGEGPQSIEIEATPATLPGAPTGLVSQAGDSFIELTWTTPASDGGSPITNYIIYRGESSGSETFLEEIDNLLTYNDTAVTNGVEYFYKVSAKNAMGEGLKSVGISDIPQRTPSIPQNLKAQAGISYIYLTWEAPASDGGSSITNFRIYRGSETGGVTFLVEVTDVLTYNDTTVTNGLDYYYKVTAVNVVGESDFSNEASGAPYEYPGAPKNITAAHGDGYVYLTWEAPDSEGSSSITFYLIYRGTASGAETQIKEIGNLLYYNDTSVTNGVTYFYYIIAKNSEGEGPKSDEVSATPMTIPEMATNLAVHEGNSYVLLTWDAPTSDGGSDITNYRIYRGTSSGDLTLLMEIGKVLTYNDTTVTNGVTYYYMVTSINGIGEAPQSSEVSATPFVDTDGDNQPDHEDTDDDNDGVSDTEEIEMGTNPLVTDSDGDGYDDGVDEFPTNPDKWKKEDAKSEFPLWILIIIIIIVLILILLLVTRKKGEPKEEAPKADWDKELPPPPGTAFEEEERPETEELKDEEGQDVTETTEDDDELPPPDDEESPMEEESKEEMLKDEDLEDSEPKTDDQSIIDELLNVNKETDSS